MKIIKIRKSILLKKFSPIFVVQIVLGIFSYMAYLAYQAGTLFEKTIFLLMAPFGFAIVLLGTIFAIFLIFSKKQAIKLSSKGVEFPGLKPIFVEWENFISAEIKDRKFGGKENLTQKNQLLISYKRGKFRKELWLSPQNFSLSAENLKKEIMSFYLD